MSETVMDNSTCTLCATFSIYNSMKSDCYKSVPYLVDVLSKQPCIQRISLVKSVAVKHCETKFSKSTFSNGN